MSDNQIVRVGLGCWIFNPQGQVLLGYRLAENGKNTWEAPGGHLELNEEPAVGAARELAEETGIIIPAKDFQFVCFTNDIFPNKHYITLHYCATGVMATPKLMEPDKCGGWRWCDLDKLPQPLFLSTRNFLLSHPRL